MLRAALLLEVGAVRRRFLATATTTSIEATVPALPMMRCFIEEFV